MSKSLWAALALLPALATVASADQRPISRTAGILDVDVPASQITYLGLPFTQAPVATGEVTGVSGTVITDGAATFGDLTTTPHAFVVRGGPNDGAIRFITANTGTTVTLDSAITGLVADLNGYEIIPEWTLGSLFGVANAAGFTGGTSAGLADKVQVEVGGVVKTYFFKLPAPPFDSETGWREVGGSASADQAGVRIPLAGGVVIARVPGSSLTLTVHGVARSGTQRPTLATGLNYLSNPFGSATTLGASGLEGAVTGGTSAGVADQVRVEDAGSIKTYFFKLPAPPFDSETGWREVGGSPSADQSGVTIPAGKAVVVRKIAGGSAWAARQPFVTGP